MPNCRGDHWSVTEAVTEATAADRLAPLTARKVFLMLAYNEATDDGPSVILETTDDEDRFGSACLRPHEALAVAHALIGAVARIMGQT